jgi:hypothetical protein
MQRMADRDYRICERMTVSDTLEGSGVWLTGLRKGYIGKKWCLLDWVKESHGGCQQAGLSLFELDAL